MHLILYSDFWKEYFKSKREELGTQIDLLRTNIVKNPDNIIVYSDKYIKYLEETFPSTDKYYDDFTTLFCHLLYNPVKIKKATSSITSRNMEDEFLHLSSSLIADFFICISELPIAAIPSSICFSLINKPNHHWVFSNLAAMHELTIDRKDFANNAEIQNIFDKIFDLPISKPTIYYFDRYSNNLKNHNLFKNICHKGYSFEIYTYGIKLHSGRPVPMEPADLESRKRFILSHLGGACKVSYTKDKKLLHQRKIMFNNLIVLTDQDFEQVNIANKSWTLTITYSQLRFNQYLTDTRFYDTIV